MKKKEILKILEKRSDYLKMHRPDVYQDIDGEINEIKGMLVALSDDDDVAVPEIFTLGDPDATLANCEQTEVIKTFVELSSAVKAVATQKSLKADAYSAERKVVGKSRKAWLIVRCVCIGVFGLSAVALIVLSIMKLSGRNIEWVPEIVGMFDLFFGVAFFIIEQISDMRDKQIAEKADEAVKNGTVEQYCKIIDKSIDKSINVEGDDNVVIGRSVFTINVTGAKVKKKILNNLRSDENSPSQTAKHFSEGNDNGDQA